MTTVLTLLLINALLGAFDTLWYHEYRARLPERISSTAAELRLHVGRDLVYVGLYGTLAWWQPDGVLALFVIAGLVAEICLTMADFVVEDRDRPAIGGISPGERILHSTMAIVYGAMLAFLVPELLANIDRGSFTDWQLTRHHAPLGLSIAAAAASLGIALSGLRDALALRAIDPISGWIPRTRAKVTATPGGEDSERLLAGGS